MAANTRGSRHIPVPPGRKQRQPLVLSSHFPFLFSLGPQSMDRVPPCKEWVFQPLVPQLETLRYAQRFRSVMILNPISLPIKSRRHTNTRKKSSQYRCSSCGMAKGLGSVLTLGHTHQG